MTPTTILLMTWTLPATTPSTWWPTCPWGPARCLTTSLGLHWKTVLASLLKKRPRETQNPEGGLGGNDRWQQFSPSRRIPPPSSVREGSASLGLPSCHRPRRSRGGLQEQAWGPQGASLAAAAEAWLSLCLTASSPLTQESHSLSGTESSLWTRKLWKQNMKSIGVGEAAAAAGKAV